MKKVLLIGPGGAGKSTLATELGKKTGLPVVHLDSLYWKPDWIPTAREEWHSVLARVTAGDAWILDGNYGGTLEMRIAASDTIVVLDLPPWLCAWRLLERRLRFHGRPRPELPHRCNEQLSADFLWWALTYRRRRLPRLLSRLRAAEREGKKVHVLRSRQQVPRFLEHAA